MVAFLNDILIFLACCWLSMDRDDDDLPHKKDPDPSPYPKHDPNPNPSEQSKKFPADLELLRPRRGLAVRFRTVLDWPVPDRPSVSTKKTHLALVKFRRRPFSWFISQK